MENNIEHLKATPWDRFKKDLAEIFQIKILSLRDEFSQAHALNEYTAALLSRAQVYAEFLGWQVGLNDERLFPLFNIRGNHPLSGSTVTVETLISLGIPIPEYK